MTQIRRSERLHNLTRYFTIKSLHILKMATAYVHICMNYDCVPTFYLLLPKQHKEKRSSRPLLVSSWKIFHHQGKINEEVNFILRAVDLLSEHTVDIKTVICRK